MCPCRFWEVCLLLEGEGAVDLCARYFLESFYNCRKIFCWCCLWSFDSGLDRFLSWLCLRDLVWLVLLLVGSFAWNEPSLHRFYHRGDETKAFTFCVTNDSSTTKLSVIYWCIITEDGAFYDMVWDDGNFIRELRILRVEHRGLFLHRFHRRCWLRLWYYWRFLQR